MAADAFSPKSLSEWIRFFTLHQWEAIDRAYRRERVDQTPFHPLIAYSATVLVALCLTLQRYFGGRRFFNRHLEAYFSHLPYPDLHPHLYWVFGCVITYFVLPGLFVKFVLKKRILDFGFSLEGLRRHLPLYALMFAVVAPFVVGASMSEAFQHRYPFYKAAGDSMTQLVLWESAYGLQFMMLEFFFRGFILFTLAPYLGAHAVFVMVVPYTMIHFAKPVAETFGAVIAGTALGTLALRTRSIWGGIAIHVAVAWSMDLLALWQKGHL